jgi:hypothetical protein
MQVEYVYDGGARGVNFSFNPSLGKILLRQPVLFRIIRIIKG